MMRISDDDQQFKDFDWYCLDKEGRVGHFASAGFKRVPPSVAESAENLGSLHDYFCALPVIPNAHRLDGHLTPDRRNERYLHSFVSMANRGLFSFDTETYAGPETCYFRVAIPKQPINIVDLQKESVLS